MLVAGVLGAGASGPVTAVTDPAAVLPCRQPQLAASGPTVYLTCGAGSTIFVADSQDGGRTFSALRKVLSAPSVALGAHRGPRIAVAGDAVVISAVIATVGGGKDGNLVAVRSTDRGRSWSPPARINDAPDAAREGLQAMAAEGQFVVAAWLDLRASGTRLYTSSSADAGRSWTPNVLAYASPSGTICQCCHPSLAIGGDGTVYLMFRNEVAGHRDLYLVRGAHGHFGDAQKLGEGTWPLTACPMDGGGLSVEGETVTTVWRREQTIYLASPGEPEIKVAEGTNPAVAATPAGPVIAWTGSGGLLLAAPDRDTRVLDADGRFPALARAGRVIVAAWEHGNGTLTRALD